MRHSLRPERLLRFAGVGGLATIIYAALAWALATAGVAALPSSVAAYALSASFSFLAHKRFTFRSRGPTAGEGARFLATTAMGFGIATAAPIIAQQRGWPPSAAILLTCFMAPAFSYLLMRAWVFSQPRNLR